VFSVTGNVAVVLVFATKAELTQLQSLSETGAKLYAVPKNFDY